MGSSQTNSNDEKSGIWSQIDKHILIPGIICLSLIVILGATIPESFDAALMGTLGWIMQHLKWVYVVCVLLVTSLCAAILFTKYGDIRLGGRHAKPSIKTGTWFTLSITGTIAVGICFFGVSGPVNLFMNPPAFLGVAGGTAEAVIPVLKYCFLHYGLPPFFLICCVAMAICLVYYNGTETLKISSTLSPLIGKRVNGFIGTAINVFVIICMINCGTNMGLAVIQLNSGIGTVAGMSATPSFEPYIVVFYTVATILFACSGVHKLMGKLSNVNAAAYFLIMAFVIFFGPVSGSRLGTLGIEAAGEFFVNFVPMITFGDSVAQTGWQNNNTMFYYSWNLVPGLMQALFYVSIAYGRTLRQFVLVNCLLPAAVTGFWYVIFGGTAMLQILDGSNLFELMQQYGDGIATFAFFDMLPGGMVLKWFFILLAMITFITFADSIAFSIPMLFMKKTELDASMTRVPKLVNAAVAVSMGLLTLVLLYVGGYNALNSVIVVAGFPAAIITIFVVFSAFRILMNREKYDKTYIQELAEDREAAMAQHRESVRYIMTQENQNEKNR